jgi:hypothetical protein
LSSLQFKKKLNEISGSHGLAVEESSFLGCDVSLDGQFPTFREMVVPSFSGSNTFGLCVTSCFLRGVNEICVLLDWQETADLLCVTLQKKADVSARLLKSGTH